MFKIISDKKFRCMLAEIEELRRQLVEENRAKNAALRKLASTLHERKADGSTPSKKRRTRQ